LLRSKASPGIFSALVNTNGRLIGTTERDSPNLLLPREQDQRECRTPPAGRRSAPSPEGEQNAGPRGVDVLSYARPGQRPSSVESYAAATFFGFAVVAVAALLVALKLGASTGTAIESLVTSVKRVADGQPALSVSTRIQEIGEAAEAVTATAAALANSLRETPSGARSRSEAPCAPRWEFLAALEHELRNRSAPSASRCNSRGAPAARSGWHGRTRQSRPAVYADGAPGGRIVRGQPVAARQGDPAAGESNWVAWRGTWPKNASKSSVSGASRSSSTSRHHEGV